MKTRKKYNIKLKPDHTTNCADLELVAVWDPTHKMFHHAEAAVWIDPTQVETVERHKEESNFFGRFE